MSLELVPGSLIAGRYRLDKALGEGGMGVVWAAAHIVTGEAAALKFLKRRSEHASAQRRFLREAYAVSAARHPNVRKVHDVLEIGDDQHVLVMELLVGESLSERLKRTPKMAVEELAGIAVPVTSAIGTAHAEGIVHRDLKPANIFLVAGPQPAVKVLDFGIAKLMDGSGDGTRSSELTGSGVLLGTPCYMSPEQAFSEHDIDHRTDIWSLGIILYHALTGVLPTRAANVGQTLKLVVSEPIKPLGEVEPDLPADVVDLVSRMLSRGREERPSDLREVLSVLSRYTHVTAPPFGAPAPLSRRAPHASPATAHADGIITADSPFDTGMVASAALSIRPPRPGRARRWARYTLPGAGLAIAISVSLWQANTPLASRAAATADSSGGVIIASAGSPPPAEAPPAPETETPIAPAAARDALPPSSALEAAPSRRPWSRSERADRAVPPAAQQSNGSPTGAPPPQPASTPSGGIIERSPY